MKKTPEQEIEEMKKHIAELEKMVKKERAEDSVQQDEKDGVVLQEEKTLVAGENAEPQPNGKEESSERTATTGIKINKKKIIIGCIALVLLAVFAFAIEDKQAETMAEMTEASRQEDIAMVEDSFKHFDKSAFSAFRDYEDTCYLAMDYYTQAMYRYDKYEDNAVFKAYADYYLEILDNHYGIERDTLDYIRKQPGHVRQKYMEEAYQNRKKK